MNSRLIAEISAPDLPFPTGKCPMAHRHALPIAAAPAAPTRLAWRNPGAQTDPLTLRFTAAVDERVPHVVCVANAATGERYGCVDVFYACPGQVFEFPLSAVQSRAAVRDGLSLSLLDGMSPLWVVGSGPHAPDSILPHLYPDNGPATLENFLSLFCSDASIQPCDWMETCVLDGLQDWAAKGRAGAWEALASHLDVLLNPETGRRENIFGQPNDDESGGPESTGPFAVLASVSPRHPALRFADEGFEKHRNPDLGTIGIERIVTESNYNIAYPMMVLALKAERPHLYERALLQLETARQLLSDEDNLYLRYEIKTGARSFANWSRGVAWYFVGLVRTLALLPESERPATLVQEADRMAAWVLQYQLPEGLWPCFLKENDILPDTSGSAGIAAAIAMGIRHRIVDPSFLPVATKARDALLGCMTHDGWLRGVSQSNKRETHHMDIQRHPFRVIAPWGMGLFAQLAAALEE